MRSADLTPVHRRPHSGRRCRNSPPVRGSSPRAAGTFMVIAADSLIGTIGGGALEYMVIARARQALRDGIAPEVMDVPLGPEIGQCCGGRVEGGAEGAEPSAGGRFDRSSQGRRGGAAACVSVRLRPCRQGAGAGRWRRCPLNVHVIDTRPDELHDLPAGVDARAVPMPEAVLRSAPRGSAYAILTHDHALDFLIAAEALKRSDSPYVGMVGSKTKRAKFSSWYLAEGGERGAPAASCPADRGVWARR